MSRRAWAAFAAVLGILLVFALVASQMTLTTVTTGARGAQQLQERLRTACGAVAAEDPPLRVYGVPPAAEGAGWRWKVEATLRPGKRPGDAEVDRALERVVAACLSTDAGGKSPAGLLVRLRVPGGPEWAADYDGQGRRLPGAPK
jgi:hypothetical protein